MRGCSAKKVTVDLHSMSRMSFPKPTRRRNTIGTGHVQTSALLSANSARNFMGTAISTIRRLILRRLIRLTVSLAICQDTWRPRSLIQSPQYIDDTQDALSFAFMSSFTAISLFVEILCIMFLNNTLHRCQDESSKRCWVIDGQKAWAPKHSDDLNPF